MSRVPLDSWSKREQLCLASAVSCSGDQNWITVSRTLKSVCGNGNTRPADWYSQKNCAVQYGHLLETVESTKRKKRTNENIAGFSSPATVTVETPTELLLRRLTEERLTEIKAQMRKDQEMYCKVQKEIEALQSDGVSEQQLQEMWQEIEKEQETKRIDEMKLENRMREREQRKKDTAGSWRNSPATTRRSNLNADTTSVDMDVEDISGTPTVTGNNKQPPVPAPLLTSLLKSPGNNSSSNATNITSPTTPTPTSAGTTAASGTGSVARATAPTITTLLTSGASAIPNQPAIIMKSPNDTAFMTRPISGPPLAEVALTGRSPSQAAPTLSMLLEKNKQAAAAAGAAEKSSDSPKTLPTEEPTNPKETPAEVETEATAAEASAAADEAKAEADAEEEQLLEVFKNMDGIMDDIDIDMASVIDEDLLKDVNNVDDSPPAAPAKPEDIDFENKLDDLKRDDNAESRKSSKSPTTEKPVEVVIGSSDDSNDNIPLATVASQESKDRQQPGAATPSTATISHDVVAVDELSETITIASSSSDDMVQETTVTISDTPEIVEPVADKRETPTSENPAEGDEDIQIKVPEGERDGDHAEPVEIVDEAPKESETKPEAVDVDKMESEAPPAPKVLTTPAPNDTDEESSSLTDNSKVEEPPRSISKTRKHSEHKMDTDAPSTVTRQTPPVSSSSSTSLAPAPAPTPTPVTTARAPLLRKLPHRDRSESPMVDDDTTTASDHSTARSSSRRRCSSTPVIDSIPNSPASSEHTDDRRETRGASKKLFLSIYSTLLESKHIGPFRKAFHDEHPHKQTELCLRPMDLPTIKRNIDSGHIHNISELHRDVMLMCHNLLLIYKPHSMQHKAARHFLQDCQAIKEFSNSPVVDNSSSSSSVKTEKERTSTGNKARSGSRKSQRHH